MRPLTEKEAFECAFHEAGHCIAAVILELEFDYVTIIPDGMRMGHTAIKNPLTDIADIASVLYRTKCEEGLVQAWAGSRAEFIVCKDAAKINRHNDGDLEFIYTIATQLSNNDPEESTRLNAEAGRRCEALVTLCEDIVRILAKKLYDNGKLSRTEVLEILKDQPLAELRRKVRELW